jgi:hypothetical protein
MQPGRTIIAVTLLTVIMAFLFPYTVLAQSKSPPDLSGISPYWNPDVSRWEPFILLAAAERNIDPDLIAAVIWKESLGRAWERGPVGAVGLMGLRPFEWRPSAEELQNPWTNVAWGARALAHTIRDGEGDLYYALAAYNGGWEKIHLRVTRGYATDVLSHYARAVAVRYGLPADGNWVCIFAIERAPSPSTITVVGPQRSLARYTERPWIQADIPTVPVGVPPHATAITFVDEHGVERQVNVWLVSAATSSLAEQTIPSPSSTGSSLSGTYAIPLPAGTLDVVSTQPPSPVNTPTPIPADVAAIPSTPPPQASGPTRTVTIAAPEPHIPSPTATPTTTVPAECAGGPLQLNAWSLDKEWTADGWVATIFVQGHGGDCMYTYAWEGEIKGGPTSDPMTFKVYRTDHLAIIMGTASVTSAGQTVEVGLFLKPTGD